MPFTTKTQTTIIKETLNPETKTKTYSLYKHGQNGNDSRGLITRTLPYHEFITFCLKANPYSRHTPFTDTTRYEEKINKHLQKIPEHKPMNIEQLCLPKGFYKKCYEFMIHMGISFDQLVLYNVYEICRTKNPHHETPYKLEYFKHEQPTWLHPPTRNITYSETEKQLIKINRIQRNLKFTLQRQEELYKVYGKNYPQSSDVNIKLKQLETELRTLKEQIHEDVV